MVAKKYQRPLCMQNTNYLRAGRGHRDDEILSINAFRAAPMSFDVDWQLDNNDLFFQSVIAAIPSSLRFD